MSSRIRQIKIFCESCAPFYFALLCDTIPITKFTEGTMEPEITLTPMTARMYHAFFRDYQNDADLYIVWKIVRKIVRKIIRKIATALMVYWG